MTEKRFNIEFDGHRYFVVIDEDNERCLARLDTRLDASAWLEIYEMLSEENEELKQRNNNQYNQLNQLWQIIEAKDWETLTAMDNQMKEDDKQLRNEWKCYE